MSAIIVVSAVIVAFFFFPVSTVEVVKGFSAKRASQWKEVLGKKEGEKESNGVVKATVNGKKVN